MSTDPTIQPSLSKAPDKSAASHCCIKSSYGLKSNWHNNAPLVSCLSFVLLFFPVLLAPLFLSLRHISVCIVMNLMARQFIKTILLKEEYSVSLTEPIYLVSTATEKLICLAPLWGDLFTYYIVALVFFSWAMIIQDILMRKNRTSTYWCLQFKNVFQPSLLQYVAITLMLLVLLYVITTYLLTVLVIYAA